MPIWIEMELWKETHPKELSFEAFKRNVEVKWYGDYLEDSRGSTPAPLSFKEWKKQRNQELAARWKPQNPIYLLMIGKNSEKQFLLSQDVKVV